jgi:leucyl/phenylalanyl-tRNA--protein transferase
MPDEPPATPWAFPSTSGASEHGIVALGADLEPGTILAAYRKGIFPMPVRDPDAMAWWSPDPRGTLPLEGLRVSRSLRRSCERFECTVNEAFEDVIEACADPVRPHGWISPDIADAYRRLHALGWVHSVETWDGDGRLVGGLYGVAVGGLFAGESMFHRERDASKVALVHLVELLRADGRPRLLDVQWATTHLQSLGAVEISRDRYLERLTEALGLPTPPGLTMRDG